MTLANASGLSPILGGYRHKPCKRKYRIEVGYGLEPILPNGKVGGFGREIVPSLRQGNYDAALLQLTASITRVIATDRGVTLGKFPQEEKLERRARALQPLPIRAKTLSELSGVRATAPTSQEGGVGNVSQQSAQVTQPPVPRGQQNSNTGQPQAGGQRGTTPPTTAARAATQNAAVTGSNS